MITLTLFYHSDPEVFLPTERWRRENALILKYVVYTHPKIEGGVESNKKWKISAGSSNFGVREVYTTGQKLSAWHIKVNLRNGGGGDNGRSMYT